MNRTHVTWTTKEIQMLEKLYPLYASKIPQLGRHTFYAINARAKHMGVKYIPKKDRDVNTKLRQWDPWEVEALRREYPYYGSRAPSLSHRSQGQINHKANHEGIKYQKKFRLGYWEGKR